MKRNIGFRFWFYFRSGWSSYFAFIFAAINTLVVTYYLAIERYPFLEAIFPNFVQYVVIIVSVGIPLLILIGYAHWKRTAAYRSEADITMESNPYVARMLVNSEILLQLNLKLTELIIKQSKNEKNQPRRRSPRLTTRIRTTRAKARRLHLYQKELSVCVWRQLKPC